MGNLPDDHVCPNGDGSKLRMVYEWPTYGAASIKQILSATVAFLFALFDVRCSMVVAMAVAMSMALLQEHAKLFFEQLLDTSDILVGPMNKIATQDVKI